LSGYWGADMLRKINYEIYSYFLFAAFLALMVFSACRGPEIKLIEKKWRTFLNQKTVDALKIFPYIYVLEERDYV
jgi:hypothetical protein